MEEANTKPRRKQALYTNDQWANSVARRFLLTEPIPMLADVDVTNENKGSNDTGYIAYSLLWESCTQSLWKYDKGYWSVLDQETSIGIIRSMIVSTEPFTGTRGEDIFEQLKYEVDRYDVVPDGWIAFKDVSWNPETDEVGEHSPARYATVNAEAEYHHLADWKDEGTKFRKFMRSICVDDKGAYLPAMETLLQEMFGYCLLSQSRKAVSFFLSGGGRNGKGVLLNLLRHMIGHSRTKSMSLTDLTASRFATASLVGMRLNVADETNTNTEALSDLFKKLIANDTITAERKYGNSFDFKPRCKYFFNVNGIPSFDTFDFAMKERIIAIPFKRKFLEAERDIYLLESLLKEMPVVTSWAVDGLRRLKKNKMIFTKFKESQDILDTFEQVSDPLADFLTGWEKSVDKYPYYVFYNEFSEWCKDNGRYRASSKKISIRLAEKIGESTTMWDPIKKNAVTAIYLTKKVIPDPTKPTFVYGDNGEGHSAMPGMAETLREEAQDLEPHGPLLRDEAHGGAVARLEE